MNCKEFESTLNDIAREALTDAEARAEASAHAAGCGPCAALLADARALTAGLRALSAEAAGAASPPRVEANLLAAFRAQKSAPTVEAAEVTPATVAAVYPFEKRSSAAGADVDGGAAPLTTRGTPVAAAFAARRWSWSRTFAAAGMAAAAAVAFVLLVPSFFSGPPTKQPTYQADSRQPSQTNIAQPSEEKIIVPPDDDDIAKLNRGEQSEKPVTRTPVASTPRAGRGVSMTNAKYTGGAARNAGARPAASNAAASERQEITTDFIPLAQGGGFAAGEGGHVVRVELPRTALAQFGLPVNAERPGGRVKADVLLGEDGMARAIRFVH